jgi:hypothetical protein
MELKEYKKELEFIRERMRKVVGNYLEKKKKPCLPDLEDMLIRLNGFLKSTKRIELK